MVAAMMPQIVNGPANDFCRSDQRWTNEFFRRIATVAIEMANERCRKISTMDQRCQPQPCRDSKRFRQRPFPRNQRGTNEGCRVVAAAAHAAFNGRSRKCSPIFPRKLTHLCRFGQRRAQRKSNDDSRTIAAGRSRHVQRYSPQTLTEEHTKIEA